MKNNFYQPLFTHAIDLISRKRYTEYEIQKKLEKKLEKIINNALESGKLTDKSEPAPDSLALVNEIISRLKELKYLDDNSYVADFVKSRIEHKPRGINFIKMELRKKGLANNIIDNIALDEISELEMAGKLLLKKEKKWSSIEPALRKRKAYYFLSSKGFSSDTVYNAVNNWYNGSAG